MKKYVVKGTNAPSAEDSLNEEPKIDTPTAVETMEDTDADKKTNHKIITRSRAEDAAKKEKKAKRVIPVVEKEKKPIDPLLAYQPPFKNKEKKIEKTDEPEKPKKVYTLEFIF